MMVLRCADKIKHETNFARRTLESLVTLREDTSNMASSFSFAPFFNYFPIHIPVMSFFPSSLTFFSGGGRRCLVSQETLVNVQDIAVKQKPFTYIFLIEPI